MLLGDGRSTSLYYDAWYGERCIADVLNDHSLDRLVLVSDFWISNQWVIPDDHLQRLLAAGLDVNQLPTPSGWMIPEFGCWTIQGSLALALLKNLFGRSMEILRQWLFCGERNCTLL